MHIFPNAPMNAECHLLYCELFTNLCSDQKTKNSKNWVIYLISQFHYYCLFFLSLFMQFFVCMMHDARTLIQSDSTQMCPLSIIIWRLTRLCVILLPVFFFVSFSIFALDLLSWRGFIYCMNSWMAKLEVAINMVSLYV